MRRFFIIAGTAVVALVLVGTTVVVGGIYMVGSYRCRLSVAGTGLVGSYSLIDGCTVTVLGTRVRL